MSSSWYKRKPKLSNKAKKNQIKLFMKHLKKTELKNAK